MSIADDIERLAILRNKGLFTEEEFISKKIKLIKEIIPNLYVKEGIVKEQHDEIKDEEEQEELNLIWTTSKMNCSERKKVVKDFFVEEEYDKFTQTKIVKSLGNINIKGNTDLYKFFKNSLYPDSHEFIMSVEYRYNNEIDSIFFIFTYRNVDDEFLNIDNLSMLLLLDNNERISLDGLSGYKKDKKKYIHDDEYHTSYVEMAQLSVTVLDMMKIANSKKIDYRIHMGSLIVEGDFDDDTTFKGFYNSVFDEDFCLKELFYVAKRYDYWKTGIIH